MNAMKMGRRRTRRRVIALGLMLALGVSALEALAGPVRDGSLHHESNIEASSHRFAAGHEHFGSAKSVTRPTTGAESQLHVAPPARKPTQQHRGGDDHCAHVHAVALIPTASQMFSAIVIDAPMTTHQRHDDPSRTSLPDPPRA